VLVDSERLAVRVESQVLAELGWPIGEDGVIERFLGRSAAYMHAEVEAALGRPVDWEATFGLAHRAAFDAELTAVDGVAELVDRLVARGMPVCVASSSTHDALAYKLARTGLAPHFDGRVFSVEDVANAKPAPDVFLHAARSLGADPASCAVVEDSPSGVTAGVAAGMAVFAFAGGLTDAEGLAAPGVTVFDEMAQLEGLLDARAR
jgi:HAD superfamily hydrolase (TIGR01509 family)